MSWLSRIWVNVRKRGFKDIIRPWKWHVFLQGEAIKEEGVVFNLGDDDRLNLKEEDVVAFCEQFVYRQNLCKPCVLAGKCEHCGCAVPGNMITPTNVCSGGNWGAMMKTPEWKEFKKSTNLNFNINYGKNR